MKRETLAVLVDRLPPFNGHWTADHVDRWFSWFFALLEEVKKPASREGVAADIGLPNDWPTLVPT